MYVVRDNRDLKPMYDAWKPSYSELFFVTVGDLIPCNAVDEFATEYWRNFNFAYIGLRKNSYKNFPLLSYVMEYTHHSSNRVWDEYVFDNVVT